MSDYKPQGLIPKDTSLTTQQGGLLVVKKGVVLFQHFDQGTGKTTTHGDTNQGHTDVSHTPTQKGDTAWQGRAWLFQSDQG